MDYIILFSGSTAIVWTNAELIHLSLGFGSEAIPGLSFLWRNKSYPSTFWDLLTEVGPLWFPIGCFAYNVNFLSTWGASSEVVFEIEWRANYFGSLRAKIILAPLGIPNELDPQWINQEYCWFKPPHYLQACTANSPIRRWCCRQNDLLLTESHVHLEDNSKCLKGYENRESHHSQSFLNKLPTWLEQRLQLRFLYLWISSLT